ncbi:hypothetical protein [Halarchaeum salinum]
MDNIFPDEKWEPAQPASDTELWRYIDFTQFVSILENDALWFSRAAGFFDSYEGALPPGKLREIADGVSDRVSDQEEFILAFYNALRNSTYISCWHEASEETAAMWQVYQQKGKEVAVKTTASRFERALDTGSKVVSGQVEYIDYSNTADITVNRISPFFFKRESFEPESEFRGVISDFESPDGVRINEDFTDRVAEESSPGMSVAVDTSELIEEVYISPVAGGWLESLVDDVLNTYGLEDIPVHPSTLNEDPFE